MSSTTPAPALAEKQNVQLSQRDFERFVEMIENPKPPTENLREAMAKYDDLKHANPDSNL